MLSEEEKGRKRPPAQPRTGEIAAAGEERPRRSGGPAGTRQQLKPAAQRRRTAVGARSTNAAIGAIALQ